MMRVLYEILMKYLIAQFLSLVNLALTEINQVFIEINPFLNGINQILVEINL